jgi:hypothetical protein
MPLLKDDARRKAGAETWSDPGSFATTLVTLFHDTYGTEAYAWHARTILLEVRDDFRVEIPRPNFDRLMAGISLVTTDDFYAKAADFNMLCQVLSGDVFDPALFDLADAADCAWGITEALLLSPPEEDDESPFSSEIVAFIGKVLDREGIIHPPDILRIGSRSGDVAARVQADFSDDPAMFSAIYKREDEKTREINDIVRGNLARLTHQLGRLVLVDGDAAGLAARLSKNL